MNLRTVIRAAIVIGALACAAPPAMAVDPSEILPNAELESRARKLSAELRCVVCQNQWMDHSNAPLAKDLRVLVRERLVAGDNDRQVLDYIVARYGEFVLLRPPLGLHTLILWLAPLFVLGATGAWIVFRMRTKATAAGPAPLTAEERRRLEALLSEPDAGKQA